MTRCPESDLTMTSQEISAVLEKDENIQLAFEVSIRYRGRIPTDGGFGPPNLAIAL